MTDRPEENPRLENLELNRETVQDLGEGQSEAARGGQVMQPPVGTIAVSVYCVTVMVNSNCGCTT